MLRRHHSPGLHFVTSELRRHATDTESHYRTLSLFVDLRKRNRATRFEQMQ